MFKKENIVMWLILVVIVGYVGNQFLEKMEFEKELETFELEQEIYETEQEIELIEDYIEFCEDSAYCE